MSTVQRLLGAVSGGSSPDGGPDPYARLLRTGAGRAVAKQAGLPRPVDLLRRGDRPEPVRSPVLLLGAGAGSDAIGDLLLAWDADVRRHVAEMTQIGTIVLVADELAAPADLGPLRAELPRALKKLGPHGRVIVLSRAPGHPDPAVEAARCGVEGFVRSLGHEMRYGATANGIQVADGIDLDSPSVTGALRFLLSARSAYVDGQLLLVSSAAGRLPADWDRPLAGRTVLLTGAARGIGAETARTLAADGAALVLLDVPAAGSALADLANDLRAVPIQLDVTAADAGERLRAVLAEKSLVVDGIVHNAGVLRDRLQANMTDAEWDAVLGVNITAPLALNDALLGSDVVAADAHVVGLASTSGIAGNRGQTNYATSKAGMMGMARATAARLAATGGTANAVAPGFIETAMTAKIPAVPREIARRSNSMAQGGRPVDVAEAIAFLLTPAAAGIVGRTLRVCGQLQVGQ